MFLQRYITKYNKIINPVLVNDTQTSLLPSKRAVFIFGPR